MSTGQPDTATETERPPVPPPLPQFTAVLLAGLSVVMIVGGGVVTVAGARLSELVPARLIGPQIAAPLPFPNPGPSTKRPGTKRPAPKPSGPDAVAALSAADARAELRRQADADADEVAALAGSWVPQVSSKCAGVPVDIGPDWMPNGRAETKSVSTAQIAAFHTSLRDRFGALTAYPTAVGIDRDKGTHGACAGRLVWLSLAPHSFARAASANAWCDDEGLPRRECGARLVEPGGTSRFAARD